MWKGNGRLRPSPPILRPNQVMSFSATHSGTREHSTGRSVPLPTWVPVQLPAGLGEEGDHREQAGKSVPYPHIPPHQQHPCMRHRKRVSLGFPHLLLVSVQLQSRGFPCTSISHSQIGIALPTSRGSFEMRQSPAIPQSDFGK